MTTWLGPMAALVAGLMLAAWLLLWIRRASVVARLRIWLDPQYRDGRHVARRSTGRHAAEGLGASGAKDGGPIPHRRDLRIRRLAPTTAFRYHDD
jgi:hypothetical protein